MQYCKLFQPLMASRGLPGTQQHLAASRRQLAVTPLRGMALWVCRLLWTLYITKLCTSCTRKWPHRKSLWAGE